MVKCFTKQGLEKLRAELLGLKAAKKEAAKEVAKAAAFGDLSENAAYSQAKEKNRALDDKIFALEKMLSNARVLEKDNCQTAQLGSTVVLQSADGKETFTLVSPAEADIMKNLISVDSPLGKALLNKNVDEKAQVATTAGVLAYTIISIE